jgi:hypothetical protein
MNADFKAVYARLPAPDDTSLDAWDHLSKDSFYLRSSASICGGNFPLSAFPCSSAVLIE